jgi:hypothetical protein
MKCPSKCPDAVVSNFQFVRLIHAPDVHMLMAAGMPVGLHPGKASGTAVVQLVWTSG